MQAKQQATTTTTTVVICDSCGKSVTSYYTNADDSMRVCCSCHTWQPYGSETPSIRHTNSTTTATKRTSARETQRVARERVVQQSLRREGTARFNELVEVFSCASTSTPGARYTITHDTVTGAVACNCPAGEHQRGCLHAEAVTRYLRNRADAINKAADEAVRAHEAMEQHAKDTALLRRNNQPFSMWK